MPKAKKKQKIQYYTIVFEKYMEIVVEIDKTYFIVSDHLKELIEKTKVEDWSSGPINDFIESYLLLDTYRAFLDDKINNPTDQEVELTIKNNIKDVLFTQEELGVMQQLYLTIEARKEYLLFKHNFSCSLN